MLKLSNNTFHDQSFWLKKATIWDVLCLSLFTFLVTIQPYFLHHEIIMMETGIHLPVINALFDGQIPYRDFFFLRGPFELYVPAFLMKVFGVNSVILPYFYYGGFLLMYLFVIMLAAKLFRSRLLTIMFLLPMLARTWPRIAYYYWGGMRYALGILVLLLLWMFFQKKNRVLIFSTGIVSALALLTTIEAGVATILATCFALGAGILFLPHERPFYLKSLGHFVIGLSAILLPYALYLIVNNAWQPFWESIYVVVRLSNMEFPGAEGSRPMGLLGFLEGFLIPGSKFYKYMTPGYTYVFFAGHLIYRWRKKTLTHQDAYLVGLGIYAMILFGAAFRKIEGSHLDMSLVVEKVLILIMVERFFYFLRDSQFNRKTMLTNIFMWLIIISSVGYAFQRYDHRFISFRLIKRHLFGMETKEVSFIEHQEKERISQVERANGHVAPKWQAQEIKEVVSFLKANTQPGEEVFCYPEVANFNFWANRPFVGRFPYSYLFLVLRALA